MDLQWHCPAPIVSAILDFDKHCNYDVGALAKGLDTLSCTYIEIRCYDTLPMAVYSSFLSGFKGTSVISINLVLAYDDKVDEQGWRALCDQCDQVTNLTIHGSPGKRQLHTKNTGIEIMYIEERIESARCCGRIRPDYFTAYIETFTESLAYNSCLNRKIGVDVNGNIKNCPSMKESFGNVRDTTLAEALNKPGFKKYWNITKDQISVCKDCESRHVYTDCRAYLEDPEDDYSKPLKCGYNPYTCAWEEWSTHPMKQRAIDHYRTRNIN